MSINRLPPVGTWLEELSAIDESLRTSRLAEMKAEVKRQGGCASLQTANGLPCRRCPKVGYPTCRKHGERQPQTMAKAERLLAVARIPAIDGLLDELDQYDLETCDTCGYPRHSLKERKFICTIRFKLLAILGMGPKSTVDLVMKRLEDDQSLDVSVLTDEEFEELGDLLAAMERLKSRVQARLAQTVTVVGQSPLTLASGAITLAPGTPLALPSASDE